MKERELISGNFAKGGINDSTLREGEQFNGSQFTLKDQTLILSWLYLIGVDTAEVGNPGNEAICPDVKRLSKIKNRPPLMLHVRNRPSDLTAALETGVEGVHIMCAADPERLRTIGSGQRLEEHIDLMVENVRRAQTENLAVRVSVEHGLEPRFFADALRILKVADQLGVDRVQVADTRGALFAWELREVVKTLRREVRSHIGVHLHNDRGLAVSNALEALLAGANWIDTTLLGVGERMGITPLGMLLVDLHGINPALVEKYNLAQLKNVEEQMSRMIHIQIPHNLNSSDTAFSHKAKLHATAMKRQGVQIYEAYEPSLVGNSRIIVTDSRISARN